MERKSDLLELISLLEVASDSYESIELTTGKLIVEVIDGLKKEELLCKSGSQTILEITVKTGIYICVLDESPRIERLFRVILNRKK